MRRRKFMMIKLAPKLKKMYMYVNWELKLYFKTSVSLDVAQLIISMHLISGNEYLTNYF